MRLARAGILMLAAAVAVGACSSDKGVRSLSKPGDGPDEFSIIPSKPLVLPSDYAALPAPTPGGGNLTDLTPKADVVAALGGSRAAVDPNRGISRSDSGVVAYASRFGVPADIRTTLATEDADFRSRRGRFTNIRIVKEDRYNEVYKPQTLDAFGELDRWRRAGVSTPAVGTLPTKKAARLR